MDPADLPSFAGALYCSDDAGCGLFPVTVSTNFSGVYGTGNAVAAAVAEGSTASSAPNRRRRRLTTTEPLREEGGGNGIGTNDDDGDDEHRVVRVRKDNGLDALTSEQDMIDMFLRHRYGALPHGAAIVDIEIVKYSIEITQHGVDTVLGKSPLYKKGRWAGSTRCTLC